MLIKPFASLSDINVSSPKKTLPFVRRRIAVGKENNARIEELSFDTKNKTITKTCSYGKFNNRYGLGRAIDIDSKIRVVSDMMTGECIDYGINSQTPNFTDNKTYQLLGNNYDNSNTYIIQDTDRIYPSNYVDEFLHISTFDPNSIINKVWSAEEVLQMDYTDLIGLLDSFFTQWGFNFPFDSYIVIDTKTKQFTPKFTYLNGIMDKNSVLSLFAAYVREISKLVEYISRCCEIFDNRHFRIKIFTNAFVSVIVINDIDYKEIEYKLNPSNCDHFRSLVNNKLACKSYGLTEAASILFNTKNKNISDEILQSIDFLDNFTLF